MVDRPLEHLLFEARSLRRGTGVTLSSEDFMPLTKLAEPFDTARLRRPERLVRPGLAVA